MLTSLPTKIVDGIQVRQIPGYPNYWISSHGAVWTDEKVIFCGIGRSAKRTMAGKWRRVKTSGRPCVSLHRDTIETKHNIHVLVALCWIGLPPFEGAQVLHRDDDRFNNCCLNLYYGNPADNGSDRIKNKRNQIGEDHYRSNLSETQVKEIFVRAWKGEYQRGLAKEFNTTELVVSQIKHGATWKHITKEFSHSV